MAAWIAGERARKGWKVEELSQRLIELGYEAEVATIRVWEAPRGRDPKPETIEGLETLFGSAAPNDHEAGLDAELAAAIREQAAAIDRLAAALEQDRENGPPWAEALAVILGASLRGSHNGEPDGPHGSGAPLRDLA